MPGRKNPNEEKKRSVNFNLLLPIPFQVAMTPSELKVLDDFVEKLKKQGRNKNRSDILRGVFLDKIKCKHESSIPSKYPEVREKMLELKQQSIKVGMGIFPSQFSKTMLIGLNEEFKKENEKLKKE